ncbi:hypothetical protein NQ317_009073 [Molorchus minor]|uniref:Uncharacterized protein n=1 Tax=Molorchus minor TaxID=1323400 RepID=A0ABQ9IS58_9CUCU|nr:hypothetical protein NQ317_009073 [Molorchus minor]
MFPFLNTAAATACQKCKERKHLFYLFIMGKPRENSNLASFPFDRCCWTPGFKYTLHFILIEHIEQIILVEQPFHTYIVLIIVKLGISDLGTMNYINTPHLIAEGKMKIKTKPVLFILKRKKTIKTYLKFHKESLEDDRFVDEFYKSNEKYNPTSDIPADIESVSNALLSKVKSNKEELHKCETEEEKQPKIKQSKVEDKENFLTTINKVIPKTQNTTD